MLETSRRPGDVKKGGGNSHRIKKSADLQLSRRDRAIKLFLFVGSMFVFWAVSRHEFIAYDAQSMVAVAHDLVSHFSLVASTEFHDYFHYSTPYSPYGIGLSIVIVPFFAVGELTGDVPTVLSIINPIIVSATVVFCYAIGRRLQWSSRLAVLAAVTFGMLTMALQSTTELFSEPAVALCIAVLIWGALRWKDDWRFGPLVIGLAAGAAIQFRSDSILTVLIGLVALPLFVPWKTLLSRSALAGLGIPIALSLVALGAYNYLRWHSVLKFSYNGQGYGTPFGRGLEGLLFSPGKSFFLYNPIAILGVIGLVVLVFTNRPVGFLFVLLIVPRVFLFAKWGQWEGGVDWGPRFLMPVVMLFVLGAVEILHQVRFDSAMSVAAWGVFTVLCIASVGVNFLSVRVPYEQWIQTLNSPALSARYEFGEPLIAHRSSPGATRTAYDFTYRASQIHGDVDLLRAGTAKVAPEEFGSDRNAVGASLLGVGALALLGSALLANRSDRLRSRRRSPRSTRAPSEV